MILRNVRPIQGLHYICDTRTPTEDGQVIEAFNQDVFTLDIEGHPYVVKAQLAEPEWKYLVCLNDLWFVMRSSNDIDCNPNNSTAPYFLVNYEDGRNIYYRRESINTIAFMTALESLEREL